MKLVTVESVMFLHHKPKQLGFTLLELLVVIGIIAVLVGIGSVSFSTAQMKARNAKRKADLQTLHKALEQYYSICGYKYPEPLSDANGKYYDTIVCLTPTVAILDKSLKDPKTGTPYYCDTTVSCSESQYKICTQLEPDNTKFCVSNSQ